MKTALITGANKGIGFGIARQLANEGIYVYLGSRDAANGQRAVDALKAEGLTNVETVVLDVNDQASVDAASAEIAAKTDTLDILINNAGIIGDEDQNPLTSSIDSIKGTFETNFYGPIRVTQAFIDLMRDAPAPRIVNVSSGLASQTAATDPDNPYYTFKMTAYQSSKTALNMYTIQLAYDLRGSDFKVNAVCPGYISTDINNHEGLEPVEVGAARIAKYALLDADGPTGKYFSEAVFGEGEAKW